MQPSWLDAVSYNADIRGLCPRVLRLATKCEGLLLSLQLAALLQSVCNACIAGSCHAGVGCCHTQHQAPRLCRQVAAECQ
jgi:hypothetical protein